MRVCAPRWTELPMGCGTRKETSGTGSHSSCRTSRRIPFPIWPLITESAEGDRHPTATPKVRVTGVSGIYHGRSAFPPPGRDMCGYLRHRHRDTDCILLVDGSRALGRRGVVGIVVATAGMAPDVQPISQPSRFATEFLVGAVEHHGWTGRVLGPITLGRARGR